MPSGPKWMGDFLEKTVMSVEGLLGSRVKVLEATHITPNVKKIKFVGNISRMNFRIGYAIVIRVNDKEFRNYTPSYYDKRQGILEVIFHIHGNAPGSNFIDKLKKDDEILISMPRGNNQYDPSRNRHLFFGDETSLSLAVAAQPILKKNKHQFQFYFELDDENKEAPGILGLENYSVFDKNDIFKNENKILCLPIITENVWENANFVLTGNGRSVQTFRRTLKQKYPSAKISAKGYWLEGKMGL